MHLAIDELPMHNTVYRIVRFQRISDETELKQLVTKGRHCECDHDESLSGYKRRASALSAITIEK